MYTSQLNMYYPLLQHSICDVQFDPGVSSFWLPVRQHGGDNSQFPGTHPRAALKRDVRAINLKDISQQTQQDPLRSSKMITWRRIGRATRADDQFNMPSLAHPPEFDCLSPIIIVT